MARTRKAATARKAKRKSTTRKSAKRAAAKRRPARKVARKAAKPRSIGGRIVKAVDSVLDAFSEAERLHTRTTRKAGFQEFE